MKIDWKLVGKSIGAFLRKRSPEILTGIGIAGMATSVVLTVKATKKATEILKEDGQETHTPVEMIKKTWKCYIPTVVSFGASTACIICASNKYIRRNAALAAACSVTEQALQDYKSAANDMLGEKKAETLQEKAGLKSLERHEFSDDDYICTGTQVMFYDPWSGRAFPYDIDKMHKAFELLNKRILEAQQKSPFECDEFIPLNEFYDLLGLDLTNSGEVLGWVSSYGLVMEKATSTLINDRPYHVVDFSRPPTDPYA